MKWCIILWAFFSCGSAVINTLSSTVLSPVQGQSQALSFQIRKKKRKMVLFKQNLLVTQLTTHLAAILQYLNDSVFKCSVCLLEK